MENILRGRDMGIDLGTSTVLVYLKGRGVVLREPSLVAVHRDSGQALAVGLDAEALLERSPGEAVALRPLRHGVICDFAMTEEMLRAFLRRLSPTRLLKPRLVICVPSEISEVEERAVMDAGAQAGASHVYLMEEPLAAALGAGVDIHRPDGAMILDVGGGTTDLAILSLSGIVESASLKVAGDQFDEAIVKYLRQTHRVLVGEGTARRLKEEIGHLNPHDGTPAMAVKGRCLSSGLPKTATVTPGELQDALMPVAAQIADALLAMLERTPPELLSDIARDGIHLTGGGSLLGGFSQYIQMQTGIAARPAPEAQSAVAMGVGKALDQLAGGKGRSEGPGLWKQ